MDLSNPSMDSATKVSEKVADKKEEWLLMLIVLYGAGLFLWLKGLHF